MPKILFIVPHRKGRSPGQRFRFEQYLDFLRDNNFDHEYSFIISEKDDPNFYSRGKYFKKLLILLKGFSKRFRDLRRAGNADIVFIYREAIPFPLTYFEKRFAKKKCKVIFDFDDSIWLLDISDGNSNLKYLKNPAKTPLIIQLSDMVFAGNNYLCKYAEQFNQNVKLIPTTLDTDYHKAMSFEKQNPEKICIGWTGSATTLKHFEKAVPFLKELITKYSDKIYIKLIADKEPEKIEIPVNFCHWSKENEVSDLAELDIGIMPLPDDEWSKGKCGFKGLQYMAMEIPAVMSPVGMNRDLISSGENGFLADKDEEWIEILSNLIDNESLRKEIGKAGRETVVNHYSFQALKSKYIKYFKELLNE